MLQQTVRRAYTSGFNGQLVEDGPRRARPGRIVAPTNPLFQNSMGRAFGFVGEIVLPDSAENGVGYVSEVQLGGPVFFGILGQPTSYALFGTAGDTLGAADDLPDGSVGEFFDMATGLCVQIFNEKDTAITNHFGDRIAYMAGAAASPAGVPPGGLIALPPDASAAPAGYIVIPNARLVRTFDMAASPAGVPVVALSIIQLTQ